MLGGREGTGAFCRGVIGWSLVKRGSSRREGWAQVADYNFGQVGMF